jgi:O-succinylbenzoate synthase
MIEQPLDYDDVMDHVQLQKEIATPICLDESIHTVRIARDAIEAKACKIINVKKFAHRCASSPESFFGTS